MNINKLYTKIEEEESQMMTVIQENLVQKSLERLQMKRLKLKIRRKE